MPVLVDLLISHGIASVDTYNGFALVNGDWPALRARYTTQGEHNIPCLDVELWIDANRVIHETYGGLGNNDAEARQNALAYFCDLSLHVFLAAFWGQKCCDQVDEEVWTINGQAWNAYVSPCIRRATDGADIPFPLELLPTVQNLIEARTSQSDVISLSIFYGGVPDARVAEVCIDNELDQTLSAAVAALSWPDSDLYYSIRNFVVLRREPQSSQP